MMKKELERLESTSRNAADVNVLRQIYYFAAPHISQSLFIHSLEIDSMDSKIREICGVLLNFSRTATDFDKFITIFKNGIMCDWFVLNPQKAAKLFEKIESCDGKDAPFDKYEYARGNETWANTVTLFSVKNADRLIRMSANPRWLLHYVAVCPDFASLAF